MTRAVVCLVVAVALAESFLRTGVLPSYRSARVRALRSARVVVAGDSFSLDQDGMAVGRLRHALAARGVGLVSLAQPGMGPRDYRDAIVEALAMGRPDVLVVNYYVGNDVSDTMRARRDVPGWRSRLRRVVRRSFLAGLILDGAGAVRQWWMLQRVPVGGQVSSARNPFLVDLGRRQPGYLAWNLDLAGPEPLAAWRENQDLLREIRDRCRAAGVTLRVHIWPSTVQVNGSHLAFYRGLGFETDASWASRDRPQAQFTAFCAAEGLVCRDWLPALRSDGRELYLDGDDHWNETGHQVAFDLLYGDLAPLIR